MAFLKSLLAATLAWLGFGLSPEDEAKIMMNAFVDQCVVPLELGAPTNFDGFKVLPEEFWSLKDKRIIAQGVSPEAEMTLSAMEAEGLSGCRLMQAMQEVDDGFPLAISLFEAWIAKKVETGLYIERRRCVTDDYSYEVMVESASHRQKPIRVLLHYRRSVPLVIAIAAETPGDSKVEGC